MVTIDIRRSIIASLDFKDLKPGKAYEIIDCGSLLPSAFKGAVGIATGGKDSGDDLGYFYVVDGAKIDPESNRKNILVTEYDYCKFREIECNITFKV